MIFCPALPLHPESLPAFSDSCTQRSARLSFSFGRCRYIVCIEIHAVLLHFQTISQWFLFPTYKSLCSREYGGSPHWLPDTLPDMPVDHFLMFFTFRAFGKIGTVFTDAFITLVFFVTIPVCCPISKDLIRRTDIAVMLYAKTCLCSPFRNQPLSGSEASGALTYYEERREFLSIYA